MRIFKIILGILFLVSAALQYNDPDPWTWIVMYGLVGLVALQSAFGRHYRLLVLLAMAICGVELISSFTGFSTWWKEGFPDITGHMDDALPYIEETREFFGSLLCLGALIFFYIHHRKQDLDRLEEGR